MAADSLMRKIAIWINSLPDQTAGALEVSDKFDLPVCDAGRRVRDIARARRVYKARLVSAFGDTPRVQVLEVRPVLQTRPDQKPKPKTKPAPATEKVLPTPRTPLALQLMRPPRLSR